MPKFRQISAQHQTRAMTSDLNPYRNIDLRALRSSLAGWSGWEATPQDAAKFAKLAWKLGLGHFDQDSIRALWRIGLLRADVVTAEAQTNVPGFEWAPTPHGFRYIDMRSPRRRPEGAPSFVPEGPSPEDQLTPYFHPYKVLVLHHVARTLRINTSNTQYLIWTPGVLSVVDWQLRELQHWTESDAFIERFDHWNWITELAVVCEPVRWTRPGPVDTGSSEQTWLQSYGRRLEVVLRSLPGDAVRSIRHAFALSASDFDSNSGLHTLLRLMNRFERDRIEDRIGAAIRLLDAAESIRRAVERLLQIQLPEEDQIGAGTWMDGARKNLYGTERVFDASPGTLRDYLGRFGLDAGVKVRCYVEGDTELGALRHVVGHPSQCTFINLRGTVIEKHGRGLAFADSLAADKASEIFSFIVLDADRSDFVRMLRRAAEDETFHGAFQVFAPDIELANFTIAELLDVALALSAHSGDGNQSQRHATDAMLLELEGATSGDDFFRRLHRGARLAEVDKGEEWGAALMAYAIANKTFPTGHPNCGQERPLVEFARILIRAQGVGFQLSMVYEKLNASTGRLQSRQKATRAPSGPPTT